MLIKVCAEDNRIKLRLPNFLLLNRFGLKLAAKVSKDPNFNIKLTGRQMRKIRRIIRKTKKREKDWILVEVRAEGDCTVEIKP